MRFFPSGFDPFERTGRTTSRRCCEKQHRLTMIFSFGSIRFCSLATASSTFDGIYSSYVVDDDSSSIFNYSSSYVVEDDSSWSYWDDYSSSVFNGSSSVVDDDSFWTDADYYSSSTSDDSTKGEIPVARYYHREANDTERMATATTKPRQPPRRRLRCYEPYGGNLGND